MGVDDDGDVAPVAEAELGRDGLPPFDRGAAAAEGTMLGSDALTAFGTEFVPGSGAAAVELLLPTDALPVGAVEAPFEVEPELCPGEDCVVFEVAGAAVELELAPEAELPAASVCARAGATEAAVARTAPVNRNAARIRGETPPRGGQSISPFLRQAGTDKETARTTSGARRFTSLGRGTRGEIAPRRSGARPGYFAPI